MELWCFKDQENAREYDKPSFCYRYGITPSQSKQNEDLVQETATTTVDRREMLRP